MKNKINNFFRIFSGESKDIEFTESIKIFPFTLGWIIAILLMYQAVKTNNLLFGLFSLIFAWQTGWEMSIERCCESERNKRKEEK
ncbi:uncharacterized protein CBO05P1_095 [Clostridium botulinum B str. Osaka05]|uniref:Uncharacterized protein n=1 Tax=Clostridium botulinum B str. Osaka05 TaxID=1407017 RepID=A0A060N9G1_CLOBO|nr:hypothetical protein [Clostridium botulinum]BAO04814.1 uncharacterized protein CBO05P1_095 [Clostridium botulinum B str. Osaka05]